MDCRKLYDYVDADTGIAIRNVVWFGVGKVKKEAVTKLYVTASGSVSEYNIVSVVEGSNQYGRTITLSDDNTNSWLIETKSDGKEYIADIEISRWDYAAQEILAVGENSTIFVKSIDQVVKLDNYSTEQIAVRDCLIQRLSLIKGELWYRSNYGLPLFEKVRSKGVMDATVIEIITSHPDVKKLLSFESSFVNHNYNFNFSITTNYSDETVNVSLIF